VSLVQKLDSETLTFWSRNNFAFVRVNIEVLTSVNEGEVFGSLSDEEDNVFDVENERRGPVHDVINIALGSGAYNQVIVLHTHVYDSFSEVEVIIHFVEAVINRNLVLLIEDSLDMCPRKLTINNVSENDRTVSSSSGNGSAIVTPRKIENRATFRLIERMRPS